MDFHLDILLPTRFAPEELDLQEVMVHWGGETFHRDLRYTPGVIIIFCRDAIYRLLMAHL